MVARYIIITITQFVHHIITDQVARHIIITINQVARLTIMTLIMESQINQTQINHRHLIETQEMDHQTKIHTDDKKIIIIFEKVAKNFGGLQ